jgi:hypothetical protein
MKTMGNHELLQKNEEIILAREIQILIKWEEIRENLESDLLRLVYLLFVLCLLKKIGGIEMMFLTVSTSPPQSPNYIDHQPIRSGPTPSKKA